MWPYFAWNASCTCAGSGAEPDTNRRAFFPIVRARSSGTSSSRTYIVGTPKNSVGRYDSNRAAAVAASNLATSRMWHPTAGHVCTPLPSPGTREGGEVAVVARDLPATGDGERVRGEVAVREDGALRGAGGAGGVDECGGRGGVEHHRRSIGRQGCCLGTERVDIPARGSCGELGHLRGGRYDGERLRIARDVPDLAFLVEHVDRHDDHAELHAGDPEVDDLDSVDQVESEPVTAAQSARLEQLCEPVAPSVNLAECQRRRPAVAAIVFDRGAIAALDQRAIVELNE